MRVVIYAHDFEPITVIELPQHAYNFLSEQGFVSLPVTLPVPASVVGDNDMINLLHIPKVSIRADKVRTSKGPHLMIFTDDEESALLLKSAFLPGQQRAVQDQRDRAFAKGFLDALQKIGGGV